MNQEMISYLSTCYDELRDLNQKLYDNPEDSYKEFSACDSICNLLESHGFDVKKNFLDLETSFYASKGNTYPKICFLCVPGEGHLTGHNLLTTISLGASLALSKVIDNIGGTAIVIGCPGEYRGGTKSIMVKQGVFEDIDAVLVAHPDVTTNESGTSAAIVSLKIKFLGNSGLSFLNNDTYTSLDGILLTFNILNSILKGFPKDVEVNSILSQGGFTPLLLPMESEAQFYIRATEMDIAKIAENKLREIAIYVSKLIRVQYSFSLYECPNEELITNRTLNRLFSHNLKENGIIDIGSPKDVRSGLSIGIVSKTVPCIHPYVNIIEDNRIRYGTKEFSEATISNFAFEQSMKASLALAATAVDLITNNTLLNEIKDEFFKEK